MIISDFLALDTVQITIDLGDSGSVEISHREQCFILRILRVTYLFQTLVKNAFRKIKVRLPNSVDKEFLI